MPLDILCPEMNRDVGENRRSQYNRYKKEQKEVGLRKRPRGNSGRRRKKRKMRDAIFKIHNHV